MKNLFHQNSQLKNSPLRGDFWLWMSLSGTDWADLQSNTQNSSELTTKYVYLSPYREAVVPPPTITRTPGWKPSASDKERAKQNILNTVKKSILRSAGVDIQYLDQIDLSDIIPEPSYDENGYFYTLEITKSQAEKAVASAQSQAERKGLKRQVESPRAESPLPSVREQYEEYQATQSERKKLSESIEKPENIPLERAQQILATLEDPKSLTPEELKKVKEIAKEVDAELLFSKMQEEFEDFAAKENLGREIIDGSKKWFGELKDSWKDSLEEGNWANGAKIGGGFWFLSTVFGLGGIANLTSGHHWKTSARKQWKWMTAGFIGAQIGGVPVLETVGHLYKGAFRLTGAAAMKAPEIVDNLLNPQGLKEALMGKNAPESPFEKLEKPEFLAKMYREDAPEKSILNALAQGQPIQLPPGKEATTIRILLKHYVGAMDRAMKLSTEPKNESQVLEMFQVQILLLGARKSLDAIRQSGQYDRELKEQTDWLAEGKNKVKTLPPTQAQKILNEVPKTEIEAFEAFIEKKEWGDLPLNKLSKYGFSGLLIMTYVGLLGTMYIAKGSMFLLNKTFNWEGKDKKENKENKEDLDSKASLTTILQKEKLTKEDWKSLNKELKSLGLIEKNLPEKDAIFSAMKEHSLGSKLTNLNYGELNSANLKSTQEIQEAIYNSVTSAGIKKPEKYIKVIGKEKKSREDLVSLRKSLAKFIETKEAQYSWNPDGFGKKFKAYLLDNSLTFLKKRIPKNRIKNLFKGHSLTTTGAFIHVFKELGVPPKLASRLKETTKVGKERYQNLIAMADELIKLIPK
jgi:hypothetical protein